MPKGNKILIWSRKRFKMTSTHQLDIFEGTQIPIPDNRIYKLCHTPILGSDIKIFTMDDRHNRINVTYVKANGTNTVFIPKEVISPYVEIEYSCYETYTYNLTKSDLKTGMMLTFKNNKNGIILKDTECGDIVSTDGIYRSLSEWNEDLSHSKISNRDVDCIWESETPNGCLLGNKTSWALKDMLTNKTRELTIDEIEKTLGYKIKIVNKT